MVNVTEVDKKYYKRAKITWKASREKYRESRAHRLPEHLQKIKYTYPNGKIRWSNTPVPLHENTRPQSLYNLHYPSIR